MQYQWAEVDFPAGFRQLGLSRPVDYNVYVMYHGTSRKAAQSIKRKGFRQSADGMLGQGVYLSRVLEKARYYPVGHPEHDKVVIRVFVNVGKVITINHQGHQRQKNWQDFGFRKVFDTAWVPPGSPGLVKSHMEVDCVWDPNRIQFDRIIYPKPVQPSCGCGGGTWGYM